MLSSLVAAQNRQKTPQKNLEAVVVELEAPVHPATLAVHPWASDLKVVLLDARNKVRKVLLPVDGLAVELKRVSQRSTLLDDGVQPGDIVIAKVPPAQPKVRHCFDGPINQLVSVPRSET